MYLKKGNSKIYYEVYGKGEALLLIHGVVTDSSLFEQAAEILAAVYKVIIYDRRGNSRSKAEDGFSFDEQADDIRDLMDELGVDSAYIAGVSGGGVIGEYFFEKYPERVKHLIMYEAAMLGHMMRTDEEFREWSAETKALLDAGRINSALLRFAQHLGPVDKRRPERTMEVSVRELGNIEHAFYSEIPAMDSYYPDMEFMRDHAEMITIAAGEKSGDTAYVREARRLADEIGKRVLYYPGGHNLPYDLPNEFAVSVAGTLRLQHHLLKK